MRTRRQGSPGPSGNRKRVRCNDKKAVDAGHPKRRRLSRHQKIQIYPNITLLPYDSQNIGITSIPVEILLEIFSYLDHSDLCALRGVSKFFESLALEPSLWTTYEVKNDQPSTSDVIAELKRMPHLRKISIEARNDCDDILRQLSCSNKRLQRLFIADCTAPTTCMQFRTFAKHVSNLDERDRDVLCSMCPTRGSRWGPLRYYMVERSDRSKTALVSYFYHDFLNFDMRRAVGNDKTTMIGGVLRRRSFRDSGTGC